MKRPECEHLTSSPHTICSFTVKSSFFPDGSFACYGEITFLLKPILGLASSHAC